MAQFLVDTNVFPDILLEQEKADEARALLQRALENEFFPSDFSLHLMGLFLFRQERHVVFQQFVKNMLLDAGVTLIGISTETRQLFDTAHAIHRIQRLPSRFNAVSI